MRLHLHGSSDAEIKCDKYWRFLAAAALYHSETCHRGRLPAFVDRARVDLARPIPHLQCQPAPGRSFPHRHCPQADGRATKRAGSLTFARGPACLAEGFFRCRKNVITAVPLATHCPKRSSFFREIKRNGLHSNTVLWPVGCSSLRPNGSRWPKMRPRAPGAIRHPL
jgi:hypothetical protein